MSRGTDVFYNGVSLSNVITRDFEQEFVLDPSGTDLIGTRVRMGFEVNVHNQNLGSILHGAVGYFVGHPNQMLADIRQRLEQPRGTLIVQTNGTNLFTINPAATAAQVGQPGTDVNNGPHPRSVRVITIIPDKSFKILFTIEFMTSGCADGQGPNIVINNRWSVHEESDPNFFRTRRISGRIRFSSAFYSAHAYLPWVVPGLEDGFRRVSITYDSLENGLEATYSIVDTQTHVAAPWPATEIQGDYSWSTNIESGVWLHHAECVLSGPPDADPKLLFARAIEIIDNRVNYLGTIGAANPKMLVDCVLSEHVGQANMVRAGFTIKLFPEVDLTTQMGNIAQNDLGKPLTLGTLQGHDYQITHSRVPSLYGTVPWGGVRSPSVLFLMACYWQDPCSPRKAIYQFPQQGSPPAAPSQDERYPQQIQGQQAPNLPSGNLQYINVYEQRTAMYTFARISDEYRTRTPRCQLPVAKRNGGAPTGPTSEIIDLAEGQATRTIRFEAERLNEWPNMPSPLDSYTDGSIEAKLKEWWVECPGERTTVDGMKKIRSLTGVYVYLLDRPPTTQATIALGKLPIHTFTDKLPIVQMANPNIAPT